MWFLILCSLFFSVNAASAAESSGGIYLGKTRVIYEQANKAESLSVHNTSSEQVWLLRAWVSAYDEDVKDNVPFIVTPPLIRFEPNSTLQLRINPTEINRLPDDRESIFRVNVLAIPPTTEMKDNSVEKNSSQGSIQFAVNNRIKLIYRPTPISSKNEVAQAYSKLNFTSEPGLLNVNNPTPYYATIGELLVDGKKYSSSAIELLVAPFSTLSLPIENKAKTIGYQLIDDNGGMTPMVNDAI